MNSAGTRKDLVVLVADRDMEATLEGLLGRHQALAIRPIAFDVFRHPGHDSGCRVQGVSFLRTFCAQYERAILIFDREGSGRDNDAPVDVEIEIDADLRRNGWDDRATTIVLDPELEIWVWSDSPHVDRICGWDNRIPSFRDWLVDEKFLDAADAKPLHPKEAFRHALRKVQKQPSSALFKKMAEKVSFKNCSDRGFLKLLNTLQTWFPALSTP